MQQLLCDVEEVPAQGSKLVSFFGRDVHVFRRADSIVAVANTCLHFGGPLVCKGDKLVCEWHGASFDLATGKRVSGPAPKTSKLMQLSTSVENGKLYYVWKDQK